MGNVSSPGRRSFTGDRSKSQSSAHGPGRPRKMSDARLTTKADPNAAMNESQPIAAQMEPPTISSLGTLTFTDRNGQPIAEPDLSNPTRPRWERPLDTIRGFQENIDRAWNEKRVLNGTGDNGSGYHSSSNSVRNSHHGNYSAPNRFSPVPENGRRRSGGGYSSRGYPGPPGHSPGPADPYQHDPYRRRQPGPDDSYGRHGSHPGHRPAHSQPQRGNPNAQGYPEWRGERGQPGAGYDHPSRAEYPDQPDHRNGNAQPSQDEQLGERDWAFQNKFGAILAYADMENPHTAENASPGPHRHAGNSHPQEPSAQTRGSGPASGGNPPRDVHSPGYPPQYPPPNRNPYASNSYNDPGYRPEDPESEYHPGIDPTAPPFEGRHSALDPISGNVASGGRSGAPGRPPFVPHQSLEKGKVAGFDRLPPPAPVQGIMS